MPNSIPTNVPVSLRHWRRDLRQTIEHVNRVRRHLICSPEQEPAVRAALASLPWDVLPPHVHVSSLAPPGTMLLGASDEQLDALFRWQPDTIDPDVAAQVVQDTRISLEVRRPASLIRITGV